MPPSSPLFPYTTLFRSDHSEDFATLAGRAKTLRDELRFLLRGGDDEYVYFVEFRGRGIFLRASPDRKSTRLNSSHRCISYAAFCLKKKRRVPARRGCDC